MAVREDADLLHVRRTGVVEEPADVPEPLGVDTQQVPVALHLRLHLVDEHFLALLRAGYPARTGGAAAAAAAAAAAISLLAPVAWVWI